MAKVIMFAVIRIPLRSMRTVMSSASYCTAVKMPASAVQLDNIARMCLIKTDNGGVIGKYPYVWLRDNCRCGQCLHPSSLGRLILMRNLDPDIVPTAVELKKADQMLQVQWPDKHSSQYPVSWLRENQFSKMTDDPVSVPNRHFWGKEMQQKIPSFMFSDIQNSDKSLHDWIEALQVYGLALIKEAPQKGGAVLQMGKRVSILKTTNYGEIYQVFSEFEASNLSNTNAELGLHCDLPFYEYSPSIQMLHCIQQVKAKGGENQFCDAYKVVEDLRHTDPEVYRVLTTVPMDFRDWGIDYNVHHMKYKRSIVEIDSNGRYKRISYNDQVRAPYLQIPVEDVHKVYHAIKKLNSEMYNKDNMIEIKLLEGDIVCFDNQRVLHGRSGFEITEASSRHLEGAYLDWDEACSRMRVIRDKMLDQQPL